ncbi:type-2 angiotensin II receptor-like [Boleophthalmus pectinirostris]|uniref:type-2 angiotensin II receptor-like n=1 Tax=Boleophthalmus pectinirostris TaxID=150288 RepID=UPI000A1C52E8|nr:type-2 angiotensin II receptor-like [Boleophthalmus pectinirostris]
MENSNYFFNSTASPNTSTASPTPSCGEEWTRIDMSTLIPTIYSIIAIFGTVGNVLAISVLAHSSTSRSVANTFMVNLCVADLLFLLALPLWAAYYSQNYNWTFGRVTCKICGALLHFNLYASIFFIMCMSMDRYLAIVHPLRSRSARDPKIARFTCIVVWVLACLCSAPTLALRDIHAIPQLNIEVCGVKYPNDTWFFALAWMKVIVGFVLPLIVICCCYCIIGRHLLADTGLVRMQSTTQSVKKCVESKDQHGKFERPPTPCPHPRSGNSKPLEGRGLQRVLWTVAAVVIAFFLCWFPFHCVTMLDVGKAYGWLGGCWVDWTIENLMPITLCLGFSNSAINPLLYCFIGHHFRGRLGGLCKGLCACVKAREEEHNSQKRGSFSTRLSSFSRKLSDLKDLAMVENS